MMKQKHLNYTYKLGQKKCHTTSSGPMSIRQMESLVKDINIDHTSNYGQPRLFAPCSQESN